MFDVTLNATEISDNLLACCTAVSTSQVLPDLTGAKVAVQEVRPVGVTQVSLEIGYRS